MNPSETAPSGPTTPAPTSALGVTLRADFEALQNDFEQASEMAADFQRQLAGKSNEFADLKHLFEKTSQSLVRLQTDIAALREERHRLANEAMRATGLEYQLNAIKAERDQLKAEITEARAAVVRASGSSLAQEEIISRLHTDLEAAKQQIMLRPSAARHDPLRDPRAASLLAEIFQSVDQLRAVLDRPAAKSSAPRSQPSAPVITAPPIAEFIDISFAS